MHFPIIDVYDHPHYGDSVRYENYVELQEVAENLEARHTALRDAVEWYLEYDQFFDWMWDQIGDNDDELPCEEEMFAGHWAARAEVDRLIANESAADCKGEG